MRGKRHSGWAYHCARRIIPAHAGQTSQLEHSVYSPADHPRACGANVSSDGMLSRCTGSSPRMRGKPALHSRAGVGHRIIPAHAGQTIGSAGLTGWNADHPRACGANVGDTSIEAFTNGSSPRMRGKHHHSPRTVRQLRIIPAHAGQTHYVLLFPRSVTDHPRACGANSPSSRFMFCFFGSSPRMRGKPP